MARQVPSKHISSGQTSGVVVKNVVSSTAPSVTASSVAYSGMVVATSSPGKEVWGSGVCEAGVVDEESPEKIWKSRLIFFLMSFRAASF